VELTLPIRDIQFTAGSPSERRTGLLGWIHLQYGELLLDGLALQQTRDGRLVLLFPTPSHRAGISRGDDVRHQIEAEVITELRWNRAIP